MCGMNASEHNESPLPVSRMQKCLTMSVSLLMTSSESDDSTSLTCESAAYPSSSMIMLMMPEAGGRVNVTTSSSREYVGVDVMSDVPMTA